MTTTPPAPARMEPPLEQRGTFVSVAADQTAPREFRWLAAGLAYGADYYPEQWSEEVWLEDARLMREAGVTTVNLGIFAWGELELADGVYEFGWLDRIIDLLHEHGIGTILATPTAVPPHWLYRDHPEMLRVDVRGMRSAPGARLGWCPSSPALREYALRIGRVLAERYGDHPALRMWHVSNEIGNENARCYCETSTAAFQVWLRERYGDPATLNDAWGTAFWGHRYASFDQVPAPSVHAGSHNPGLLLDFERFSSDALLAHYEAERDQLRRLTPDVPVTTNFMVNRDVAVVDYARWAQEVDLVSNDHYTRADDSERHWELAMSADRCRGLAGGRPWLLMEHSTSAVNWQPRNRAKASGEMLRNSIAHVARGADGVMFFQWRQSTAGAEQFHSAMLPHAGTSSKVWRESRDLGAMLERLGEVRGTTVDRGSIAMLWDYSSLWALRSGRKPTVDVDYLETPMLLHRALTRRHRVVDVVAPDTALDGYGLIVVPNLFLQQPGLAGRLERAARAGAHVVVTYLSGIADPANRIIAGGYPGAFRDLVGVVAEEFHPLLHGDSRRLDNGWTATVWTEHLHVRDADVLASIAEGELEGVPAVTRRTLGLGSVTYLSVHLEEDDLQRFADLVLEYVDVAPVAEASDGVEVVRRSGESGRYLFVINHEDADGHVVTTGTDLVSGDRVAGRVVVPAGAILVVAEDR
ncbi:beta-galactosidase [Kribbella sp. NPDC049227]|uniref:beta-galactosidase n=1 Tax=Kribbella sp. NPDC049227 TaxID=3364113 RepID=UPI0037118400